MKRLLLSFIAIFTFSTLVTSCAKKEISNNPSSQTDPKIIKACMSAADFEGCVKVMTKPKTPESNLSPSEQKLLDEIIKLPNRITRTSLINFQASVRDFADSLSIAKFENPKSELVINAQKLLLSFDVLYNQWQRKIDEDGSQNWSYVKNLKAKNTLDYLFSGNTFAIRCSEVRAIYGWTKDWSDPIFDQVFTVVHLASKQLASKGKFDFPKMDEDPLIPLQVPIDSRYKSSSGYVLGMGQRICGSKSKEIKKEEPEKEKNKPVDVNCDSPIWKNKPRCKK